MHILMQLFLVFCKIGAVTFGGGYAMLPILQREVIDNKKWITDEELMDYYSIGQCTPGVIAVNVATFIGNNSSLCLCSYFGYSISAYKEINY